MRKGSGYRGKTQTSSKIFNEAASALNFVRSAKNRPTIHDSSTGRTIGSVGTLNKNVKPVIKDLDRDASLFGDNLPDVTMEASKLYKYYSGDETSKKLEFEIRLSVDGDGVGYDYFILVYNFLSELFPEVNPMQFEERSDYIDNKKEAYTINNVIRTDLNTEVKTNYQKIKLRPIRLNRVDPFLVDLGLSLEIINGNSAPSGTGSIRERSRWSFIIKEEDNQKLAPFLRGVYKRDPSFRAQEYQIKIDLTRSVTIIKGVPGNMAFEIELELLNVKTPRDINPGALNFLSAWVKILSTVAARRGEFISFSEHQDRIINFNKLFGYDSSVLDPYMINNPTDLQNFDFSWMESSQNNPVFSLPGGCHISLKADGTRHFIYFQNSSIYLMSLKKETITLIGHMEIRNNELAGSVFDVELIRDLDVYGLAKEYVFLAFDCLAFRNVDVREQNYSSRLQHLKTAIDLFSKTNHPHIFIYFKETHLLPGPESKDPQLWFRMMNDFFERTMKENRIDFKSQTTPGGHHWEVDGYIITPEQKSYLDQTIVSFNNVEQEYSKSWVRKWKTRITIDFRVKMNASRQWGLYTNKIFPDKVVKGGVFREFLFQPRGIIYVEPPQEELAAYAYQVVECEWVPINEIKGTFKIIRKRSDKIEGNSLKIANKLMNLILKPIDTDFFLDRKLGFMRVYHNKVKRELLLKYSGDFNANTTLVDLGSGRGGDISKWDPYHKVYAVEPDQKNLEELMRRYKRVTLNIDVDAEIKTLEDFSQVERTIQTQTLHLINASKSPNKNVKEDKDRKPPPIVKVINAAAQDVDALLKYNLKNIADVVTLFNVLTFFYKSSEILDQLVNTVDNLIKDNGYFLVISMDGEKMNNLLGHRKTVKSQNITVSRTDEPNKIWIESLDGIVRGQFEYLTRLEDFSMLLKQRGYNLEDSYYLDQEIFLSEESYLYSSLYKVLVFKKGINPQQSQLKNSLFWLSQKNEMESHIRMLSPEERPVHIKSNYFDSNGIINLYRFGVLGDGSCYLHAILRTMSKSYKAMTIKEKGEFIKSLRENLSNNYTIQHHNSIGNGFFRDSKLPEYSYYNMKESLRRVGSSVSHEMLSFIGDQLNVNVYLIRGNQEAIPYNFGKDVDHIKPGRHNIVLFWINANHYEAVGKIEGNMVQFVFEDNHPLLKLF